MGQRVLVTGTTSGLGREFLRYYYTKGYSVISINRRADPALEKEFPNAQFLVEDITNTETVNRIVRGLHQKQQTPDIWVLNAGVNLIDNLEVFDLETFKDVWNINYYGVVNFIAALQRLKIKGKKIVCVSSTSNIIPNPAHISYYLSKFSLKESFQFFAKNDSSNEYKTIVLGPVATNIMAKYKKPQGINGKIFDVLVIPADEAVRSCARFIDSSKAVFNYPFKAYLFYVCVRMLLVFFPFLYKGTSKDQLLTAEAPK